MNAADYLIIGVLVISMLIGLVRGFLREAVALMAWLGGIWLAWRYSSLVEPFLGGLLSEDPVRTWSARGVVLITVLLIGWIISGVLSYALQYSDVSVALDRLLGVLFGLIRGAVVMAVVVILAQLVRLDEVSWWERSMLLPATVEFASWIRTFAETGMQMVDDHTS